MRRRRDTRALRAEGERYELAVVGAGPAGAACALVAARRGLSVLLCDPRAAGREKPCGEGVMPAGVEVLCRLGFDAALERVRAFDWLRWCVPGFEPLELELPAPGFAVRRESLQAWLDAALAREPGIALVRGRATTARADGGYAVEVGGQSFVVRALAACDGLGGTSAAWLREHGPRSRSLLLARTGVRAARIGVRAHFESARELDRVEVHLGRDAEVYLTPLADGVINAAVLRDDPRSGTELGFGASARLAAALADYPAARARLGKLLDLPTARVLCRVRPRRVAAAGAFLVGDAGGGVDPIVGCGVTIALRTGVAAAEAAAEVVAGRLDGAPERRYERAYRAEVAFRRGLAGLLGRVSRRPWLAGAALASARALPGLSRSCAARTALGGGVGAR